MKMIKIEQKITFDFPPKETPIWVYKYMCTNCHRVQYESDYSLVEGK